jgi:hypothetical protein
MFMFLSDLIFSKSEKTWKFFFYISCETFEQITDIFFIQLNFYCLAYCIVTYWDYDSTIRIGKLQNKPPESLIYIKEASLRVIRKTGFSFPSIISIWIGQSICSSKIFVCLYFKLSSKRKSENFVQCMFFPPFLCPVVHGFSTPR